MTMSYPKNIFTTIVIVLCGFVMTACPALLKHAQIIKLYDATGKVVGGIAGFKIHYTAGADKDYPEDHYSIAITNANTGAQPKDSSVPIISAEDLAKVSAIGVAKAPDIYVTSAEDTKYMCDQSLDSKSPGFGCRFLSSKLGDAKEVYIRLKLNDGTLWRSEYLDLGYVTDSKELDTEMQDFFGSIGGGKPLQLTLKACAPTDPYGSIFDVTADKACPTGTKEIPTPPLSDPSTNEDCPPPNFLDTTGKCVSILQPQKDCGADSVTLLDGSCGTGCGTFQVQKLGKCQCQSGYIKDDAGTGCVLEPSLDANLPPASTGGGGSCSLILMN